MRSIEEIGTYLIQRGTIELLDEYTEAVRAEATWSAFAISMLAAMMTGRLDDDIKTLTRYLGEEANDGQ